MSDSVRPHRRQPTRLPHPWDSPGKNTGVGCHFLLQCMKVKSENEVAQSCPTLSDPMDYSPPGPLSMGFSRQEYWSGVPSPSPTRDQPLTSCCLNLNCESCSVVADSLWPHGLYSPWNSPGQNTGVGSLYLLQGIFPTLGSNPGFPHCRWILYQLSHKGSPGIQEWVAYPFSSGSSQPRNRTRVSCIAGGFFTNWAKVHNHWTTREVPVSLS